MHVSAVGAVKVAPAVQARIWVVRVVKPGIAYTLVVRILFLHGNIEVILVIRAVLTSRFCNLLWRHTRAVCTQVAALS